MSAHIRRMSIQRLLAFLIALAVLVAPAVTRASDAFAAVPDHHAQMLKTGHCGDVAPGSNGEEGTSAKICCKSMCTAVAFALATTLSDEDVLHSPDVFTERTFLMGLPAEIATPPPRSA